MLDLLVVRGGKYVAVGTSSVSILNLISLFSTQHLMVHLSSDIG